MQPLLRSRMEATKAPRARHDSSWLSVYPHVAEAIQMKLAIRSREINTNRRRTGSRNRSCACLSQLESTLAHAVEVVSAVSWRSPPGNTSRSLRVSLCSMKRAASWRRDLVTTSARCEFMPIPGLPNLRDRSMRWPTLSASTSFSERDSSHRSPPRVGACWPMSWRMSCSKRPRRHCLDVFKEHLTKSKSAAGTWSCLVKAS